MKSVEVNSSAQDVVAGLVDVYINESPQGLHKQSLQALGSTQHSMQNAPRDVRRFSARSPPDDHIAVLCHRGRRLKRLW